MEAFKFAYAYRALLGDEKFWNVEEVSSWYNVIENFKSSVKKNGILVQRCVMQLCRLKVEAVQHNLSEYQAFLRGGGRWRRREEGLTQNLSEVCVERPNFGRWRWLDETQRVTSHLRKQKLSRVWGLFCWELSWISKDCDSEKALLARVVLYRVCYRKNQNSRNHLKKL